MIGLEGMKSNSKAKRARDTEKSTTKGSEGNVGWCRRRARESPKYIPQSSQLSSVRLSCTRAQKKRPPHSDLTSPPKFGARQSQGRDPSKVWCAVQIRKILSFPRDSQISGTTPKAFLVACTASRLHDYSTDPWGRLRRDCPQNTDGPKRARESIGIDPPQFPEESRICLPGCYEMWSYSEDHVVYDRELGTR